MIELKKFISIQGTSGSGKTTLLNILGAIDRADEGNYSNDGIAVNALSDRELNEYRKSHIGFVFQNYALMNYYNVYENVEMPLIARNVNKTERKEKIEKVLERLGISDLSKKLPKNLSGGEKQRCAIARALVFEPDIILADEPTGALDSGNSELIMEYMCELKNESGIMVLVTHDEKVAAYADRRLILDNGKILIKN